MEGIRNWTLKLKMIVVFSAVIIVSSLVMGFFIYNKSKEALIREIGESLTSSAYLAAAYVPGELQDAVKSPGDMGNEAYLAIQKELTKTKEAAQLTYIYTLRQEGNKVIYVVDQEPLGSKDACQYGEVNPDILKDPAVVKTLQGERTISTEITTDKYGTFLSGYAPIKDSGGQVVGLVGVDKEISDILAQTHKIRNFIIVVTLIIIAVTILIAILFAQRVVAPLKDLTDKAEIVKEGDLTVDIKAKTSQDEIGVLSSAFLLMVKGLRDIIVKVSVSSEQLAASAEQLTVNASQTARAAEQIAVTIEEISLCCGGQVENVQNTYQAVNEINNAVQQVATNSKVALDTSQSAASYAEMGSNVIQDIVREMYDIQQAVTSSNSIVQELGQLSENIGQMSEFITSIAEQTNLLALNAAIEAARAGEQGKGFAVVAEEVKKLANQAGEAAQEISNIIKEIQIKTSQAADSMEQGNKRVDKGVSVAQEAGQAFVMINQAVGEAYNQVKEISSFTGSLGDQGQEVMEAVEKVKEVFHVLNDHVHSIVCSAQEQMASMEEVASSANLLESSALELQETVKKFKT